MKLRHNPPPEKAPPPATTTGDTNAYIKLRGKCSDLHEPVRGAKKIAEIRGETERQTFHAVAEKRFSFRNDGRVIVTTPFEALVPLIGADGIARLTVPEKSATGRQIKRCCSTW